MSDRIAVVNAGSSSIKFGVFEMGLDEHLLFKGQVEQIGVAPRLSVRDSAGESLAEKEWDAKDLDHGSATRVILETIIGLNGGRSVAAVGHRVVHGGTDFAEPAFVTDRVLALLKGLCPLAPLHQPHNLAVDRGDRRRRAAHAAGCVLRYRVSPRSAAARTELSLFRRN